VALADGQPGLSKQALCNLEAGNREPAWATVQLLALALGVDCRAFQDGALELPKAEATRPRGRPRNAPAAPKKPTKRKRP
jgi:hypothetical protein